MTPAQCPLCTKLREESLKAFLECGVAESELTNFVPEEKIQNPTQEFFEEHRRLRLRFWAAVETLEIANTKRAEHLKVGCTVWPETSKLIYRTWTPNTNSILATSRR